MGWCKRGDGGMTETHPATVLHVITALNNGGAEAMLAKLVLAARDGNGQPVHQRHVIVSMMPPGVVGRQLLAQGVPVHTLGMKRGRPDLVGLFRLLRLVRTVRPDVIQGWMYHGNIAAWLARQIGWRRACLGWN